MMYLLGLGAGPSGFSRPAALLPTPGLSANLFLAGVVGVSSHPGERD